MLRWPLLLLVALAALGCSAGSEPPRLLLLISVDTLRADHLGVYGDTRGLTPHLDRLAATSRVYRSAYAASSFTLPSVAAMLTGRHPDELGLWSNESQLPDSARTLATALSAQGWRTAAVVSNFVLRASSGLASDFDLYDDEFPQQEATRGWPERVADGTTTAAIATLDACASAPDERCFLWVHYQDPHGPYSPPDIWRDRLLEGERASEGGSRILDVKRDHTGRGGIPRYQFLFGRRDVGFYRAGYAGEVAFVDEEIGRLLAAFEARGLARGGVVAFAADHGEALGEGDLWFAHGEHLSEPIMRVPLLIRAPGLEAGVSDEPVSLVDMFPTLLTLALGREAAALELAAGDFAAPGRDLLSEEAGDPLGERSLFMASLGGASVPRYGIVEGEYKLVLSSRDGVWNGQLVRREGEEVDLTAAAPQIVSALRSRLHAFREEVAAGGQPEVQQRLTPEDREKLRALGYAE